MLSVCSEGPQFASCIGSTNISMSRLSLLVASPNSRPPCVEASGFHKFFSCIFFRECCFDYSWKTPAPMSTDSLGAIDLFMAFDDDSNGYIDYDEFLRQIFPEEYVKEGMAAMHQLGCSSH